MLIEKGVEFDSHLELSLPIAWQNNHPGNQCYNMDSNELAGNITADLVYIDPPYKSRQYCDAYHLWCCKKDGQDCVEESVLYKKSSGSV